MHQVFEIDRQDLTKQVVEVSDSLQLSEVRAFFLSADLAVVEDRLDEQRRGWAFDHGEQVLLKFSQEAVHFLAAGLVKLFLKVFIAQPLLEDHELRILCEVELVINESKQ